MSIGIEELQGRIRRMYAAIDSTVEYDTTVFRPRITMGADGLPDEVFLDFRGGMSDEQIQNAAWSAIHNIAIFYEHSRKWSRENKVKDDEVEAVTAASADLRILRDLHNLEKHPEAAPNSSGHSPQLTEVVRVARITGSGAMRLHLDGVRAAGDVKVIVDGTIINGRTGERVDGLADVLERGLEAWERFLANMGIAVENQE